LDLQKNKTNLREVGLVLEAVMFHAVRHSSAGIDQAAARAPDSVVVPLFCAKGEASAEAFRPPPRRPVPPPADTGPLFFAKGEASARQFRPAGHAAPAPAEIFFLSLPQPRPAPLEPDRLWLRLDADRHRQLKDVARRRGQTGRAVLAAALDAFLATVALGDRPALPLATAPRRRTGPRSPRAKLSLKIDASRGARTRLVAAELGQSVQSLLVAALDAELRR
jgi:hypothetical protein